MTFEWEDITEDVLERVVLVQYIPYSTNGFIDDAGSLTAITEEGQEYKIGFEEISWNRAIEIRDLFLGELPKTSFDGTKITYEMRKWRHIQTNLSRANIFITFSFYAFCGFFRFRCFCNLL